MNIFERLKLSAKMVAAGWKGESYDFSHWEGRKFWGIDNSNLATNENIFSVISRLSNIFSSLPLKLYQSYDYKTTNTFDVIANNPNHNMTSMELFNKLEVSRNETGNAYAIIFRDIRSQIEKIAPIESAYVMPFINRDDGDLWYKSMTVKPTIFIIWI